LSAVTPHAVKRYGWVPDLPDDRDHRYASVRRIAGPRPPKVDLREHCPRTVYDQGDLGSCTANAIAAAIEAVRIKKGVHSTTPSRLFIYYNERVIENTVPVDSGAMIRDGIKSVAHDGVCSETAWPYVVDWFTRRPHARAYEQAARHKVVTYERVVQNLDDLRGCLANGDPIVFGFSVYESFESAQVARTGEVSMPVGGERLLGGHAVLAVGYDDTTARFLVRNSWGPDWGQGGHFTMPYDYLINGRLSADFWAITQTA
jgi:C1A family cysteine protease